MAAKSRKSDPTLKDRLFEESYRFSFFKAVDLLEKLLPDKNPVGRTLVPGKEAVRFSVRPGFVFPPSDITELKQDRPEDPVGMSVAFLGLIGPSRVLPNWYTEMALERNRQRDYSMTAFFDLFHHRLVSLFYLAWKKYRFPENYLSGAKDFLSRDLLALIGLGTQGLTGRIGLPEESLAFYTGLLSRPMASAVSIEATVGYLSGERVWVDQFIERMLPLEKEDQTQIGAANSFLGEDTVCGSFIWESQSKFRVNIGPLDYTQFLRYLPTGDMLRPIFSLVRYMVGVEFEFEIRIYLKKEEVPGCILGAGSPQPLLGWSTWTKHPGFVHEADPNITFLNPES